MEHQGVVYGALTVVGTGTSPGVARELVDEMAAARAFKQLVTRQQHALRAETVTETDLWIQAGHVLAALAAAPSLPARATLAVEELWRAGGELSTYLVKTGVVDGETVVDAASELPAVREAGIFTESDEGALVRLRVDEPTCVGSSRRFGGAGLRRGCTLRVNEPSTPSGQIRSGGVTGKQQEALRTATYLGCFDRPQQATAGEVAEVLEISRSTFRHHLRGAEQRVFVNAFGGDTS